MKDKRRALFLGRFQPFHRGHLHRVQEILREYEWVVLGVGSAQASYTSENPFTAAERFHMIEIAMEETGIANYSIIPLEDLRVHHLWVAHVRSQVPAFEVVFTNDPLSARLFRDHGVIVKQLPLWNRTECSGTEVRRRLKSREDWKALVPPGVGSFIEQVDGVGRLEAINQRTQEP